MLELRSIQKLFLVLTVLTLVLVGLGSYVRATGAGLACPDWPLCFGVVVPDFKIIGVPQEVIHRYLATGVGMLCILLVFLTYKVSSQEPKLFRFSIFLLVLVILQGIFGGLTVTQKLHPHVVTTHLALGTLFFQSVAIGFLQTTKALRGTLRFERSSQAGFVLFTLFMTVLQLIWGGYVAASGASLACLDFPLCNGALIPENATSFQLVQIVHRILGFLLFGLFCVLFYRARKSVGGLGRRKHHITGLFGVLVLQILIGVGNIHMRVPAPMSVLHLVVAQLILLGVVSLYMNMSRGMQIYPDKVTDVAS